MRQQLRALFLNPRAGFTNDTAFYIAEYNQRSRLRKLGFTESLDSLDAFTGELFVFISEEIDKLEQEASDRRSKKR